MENGEPQHTTEVFFGKEFFILEKGARGELSEVYSISSADPSLVLKKIRDLSIEQIVAEIIVTTADHQVVLRGARDIGQQWQTITLSSDFVAYLQKGIRPGQWSQRWLFKTDRSKR
jgi:hypothetical protein